MGLSPFFLTTLIQGGVAFQIACGWLVGWSRAEIGSLDGTTLLSYFGTE